MFYKTKLAVMAIPTLCNNDRFPVQMRHLHFVNGAKNIFVTFIFLK
jgi:hypothetical protein